MYPPVIGAARGLFKALGMHITITGDQHVPREGGAVLASNHVSYLDFIFVGLAAWEHQRRLTRFMAKDAVFQHPVSGPLMRGMHHIPVDREAGSASYRSALKALKDGEVVGVFPEATISRSWTVKETKSGATRMATAARVPLVPVAVWGGQRIFTKGRPRDLTRGRAISIRVGEPMEWPRGTSPDTVATQLRERMQALLEQTQRAHPDQPVPGQDAWWHPAHLGGTAPTPEEAHEIEERERLDRAARRTSG